MAECALFLGLACAVRSVACCLPRLPPCAARRRPAALPRVLPGPSLSGGLAAPVCVFLVRHPASGHPRARQASPSSPLRSVQFPAHFRNRRSPIIRGVKKNFKKMRRGKGKITFYYRQIYRQLCKERRFKPVKRGNFTHSDLVLQKRRSACSTRLTSTSLWRALGDSNPRPFDS